MLEALKKFVKSRLFKEVLAVIAAALSGYASAGCGVLPPPNAAQLDVFECQLAALEDAVPDEAAEDIVMALRAQNYEYATLQLLRLGLDRERIAAVADAYDACSASAVEAPASLLQT